MNLDAPSHTTVSQPVALKRPKVEPKDEVGSSASPLDSEGSSTTSISEMDDSLRGRFQHRELEKENTTTAPSSSIATAQTTDTTAASATSASNNTLGSLVEDTQKMPAVFDANNTLNSTDADAVRGVTVLPARTQQAWHRHVTQDWRRDQIHEFVKAIFPSPGPAALQDWRMAELVAYAEEGERAMFDQASSKEEYHHLLAVKLCRFQTQLEEKKQKRMNEKRMNEQ